MKRLAPASMLASLSALLFAAVHGRPDSRTDSQWIRAARAGSDASVLETDAEIQPATCATGCNDGWQPEKVPAPEMAAALLEWLQSDGGVTGQVLASDLMLMWRDLCLWNGWLDTNWRDTSKALRRLIGAPEKQYCDHEGKRAVVYVIPTADEMRARAGAVSRKSAVRHHWHADDREAA